MNYQAEIEKLLNKNKFSICFLVRFALSCARDVEEYDKTNKSKECNDITQLWLNGKTTVQEIKAASAAYAASATATAYAEDRNKYSKKYYDILIEMIANLTELQREFL